MGRQDGGSGGGGGGGGGGGSHYYPIPAIITAYGYNLYTPTIITAVAMFNEGS